MDQILRELRQAARSLRRSPGFALVAILTLGLGIGASTAIYSLVDGVVLEPLPYPDADRVVQLTSETSEGTWQLSRAQYSLFRDEARSLDLLAGFRWGQATVRGAEGAERVGLWHATESFFRLTGARPALGRLINAEDDRWQGTPVAVLTDGYWRRAFGGDPSVIGRMLVINERPTEIVGVLEPGMELPAHVPAEARPDIWLPLQLNLSGQFWNSHAEFRTLARLAPGVTAEEASRELAGFNPRLIEQFPQAYAPVFMERYAFQTRATPLRERLVADVAGSLWILLGGVGLVLLIACANIANLFLVRSEGRRREMGVRAALGARRGSILRYFLSESALVTFAGAVLGLLMAYWGVEWLRAAAPANLPRVDGVTLDGGVLAFTAAVSLLVAVALSILPGLRYAGVLRTLSSLGDGGRTATAGRERQRARGALIVSQVALAMILLVGAGLLLESFRRIRAVDPGVDAAGVLVVSVPLSGERYDTRDELWSFHRELLDRVRALPGVTTAGSGQAIPMSDGYGCTIQGFADPEVARRIGEANGTLCGAQLAATDGYFEALGIPVVQGRALTHADNAQPGAGSVVVSEAFARKFWPGDDPIGRRVAPGGRTQGPFYTVVGVVGDVYATTPTEPPALAIYYPVVPIPESAGFWGSTLNLVVKSAGSDPTALFPTIRDVVRELDPAVAVANPRSMESIVAGAVSGLSFTMALLGTAAVAALLLAAIGLYGVLSYLVQRRTAEIGIRIAMGAPPARVERMVVGGSLVVAGAGLVLGGAAALVLTRFLASLLYGVQPTHPTAYLLAGAVLAGVAAAASWIPARRAAGVDPVEALRRE